jgi:hypothetical protein
VLSVCIGKVEAPKQPDRYQVVLRLFNNIGDIAGTPIEDLMGAFRAQKPGNLGRNASWAKTLEDRADFVIRGVTLAVKDFKPVDQQEEWWKATVYVHPQVEFKSGPGRVYSGNFHTEIWLFREGPKGIELKLIDQKTDRRGFMGIIR